MSERPDTWMPIYWGDYLKDTGHLGTAEHGAYLLMIGHYWCTGSPLPDNDALLAKITRQTLGKWLAMRLVMEGFFEIDGDGWHHRRVEEEMASAIERKGKAQARAEHAARTRWGKAKDAPSMPAQCPSSSPSPVEPKGSRASRGSQLPKDWTPTQEELDYATAQGCADPRDTAERFKLHHHSKGTIGKDWHAGFQYWCRNEKNFKSPAKTYIDKFAKPDVSMPAAEEWGPRVTGWVKSRFWRPLDWGPPPGEQGCRAPPKIINDVTEAYRP